MPDLKVKKIYPSEGEIEEYQKASKEIGNLKTHRKDALLNTFEFSLNNSGQISKKDRAKSYLVMGVTHLYRLR